MKRFTPLINMLSSGSLALLILVFLPRFQFIFPIEFVTTITIWLILQSAIQIFGGGIAASLSRIASVIVAKTSESDQAKHFLRHILALICILFIILTALLLLIDTNKLLYYLFLHDSHFYDEIIILSILRLTIVFFSNLCNGCNRQIEVSTNQIVANVCRFPVMYYIFSTYSLGIESFFTYQIIISLSEMIVVASIYYKCAKVFRFYSPRVILDEAQLKNWYKFLGITVVTGALWTASVNIDKILFSIRVNTDDLSKYYLIIQFGTALLFLTEPFMRAFMPTLIQLSSQKRIKETQNLFIKILSAASACVGLLASFTLFYSYEILIFVFQDNEIAAWGSEIFFYAIVAHCSMVILSIFHSLQVAYGDLKIHLVSSVINNLLQIVFFITFLGTLDLLHVIQLWCLLRVLMMTFWTYIIYQRFYTQHDKNIFQALYCPAVLYFILSLLATYIVNNLVSSDNSVVLMITMFFVSFVILLNKAVKLSNEI